MNSPQKTGAPNKLELQAKLSQWKTQHFPKLAALASTKEEAEKLFTVCMNTICKSSALMDCSIASVQNCILTSYQLNLYPGPMQECAYIPFKGTATFVPQYQGLVKLCYNGGIISSVKCHVVWEGEVFDYCEGLTTTLVHIPDLEIDHMKAERVAVYSVVRTRFGDQQIAVLTPSSIARTKAGAPGGNKPDSPWNSKNPDVLDWMWKKTALRQNLKLVPKSADMAKALTFEDAIETEASKSYSAFDMTFDDAEPEQEPQQAPQAQQPTQTAIGHEERTYVDTSNLKPQGERVAPTMDESRERVRKIQEANAAKTQ